MRHKEEGIWIATDLELCFYAQYWLQSSGIVAQLLQQPPVFLPSWKRFYISPTTKVYLSRWFSISPGRICYFPAGQNDGSGKMHSIKRLLEYPFVINSKKPEVLLFQCGYRWFWTIKKITSLQMILISHQTFTPESCSHLAHLYDQNEAALCKMTDNTTDCGKWFDCWWTIHPCIWMLSQGYLLYPTA